MGEEASRASGKRSHYEMADQVSETVNKLEK